MGRVSVIDVSHSLAGRQPTAASLVFSTGTHSRSGPVQEHDPDRAAAAVLADRVGVHGSHTSYPRAGPKPGPAKSKDIDGALSHGPIIPYALSSRAGTIGGRAAASP